MIPWNKYPSGLVPYIGLVRKIEIPDLTKPENCFDVARRIRKDKLELIDLEDDYFIIPFAMRSDFFESRDVPDLSMNIMCRDSRPEGVNYNQLGIAHDKWDKKTVIPHKYAKFVKHEDTVALVFKASDFHKKTIPYYKAILKKKDFDDLVSYMDKEDEQTQQLLNAQFASGNKYKVQGCMELEHKPTMMNYWHVTLVLHEAGGKIVKKAQSEAQRSMCKFVIDHVLATKGIIDKKGCKFLNPIYYLDTEVNSALASICRWFRNWLTSSLQLQKSSANSNVTVR
jgi:hypothetical protein